MSGTQVSWRFSHAGAMPGIVPGRPVLIAGPTASGKSALALEIAERFGGTVVNADALQVFDGWRVLTARPDDADLAAAPHALYGHVPHDAPYSAGHWLRDVQPFLKPSVNMRPVSPQDSGEAALRDAQNGIVRDAQNGIVRDAQNGIVRDAQNGIVRDAQRGIASDARPSVIGAARPIIVGGTGLYFAALTEGLADIPPTPAQVRAEGDALSLPDLLGAVDPDTRARIDTLNRARVQRAWEVQRTTGRGLAAWQADTPPPPLPLRAATPICLAPDPDWLNARIAQRFDLMLAAGALDEARRMVRAWDPAHLSSRAIGAAELIAHLRGEIPLAQARDAAVIATRRYGKRQRTWFRSRMTAWARIVPI